MLRIPSLLFVLLLTGLTACGGGGGGSSSDGGSSSSSSSSSGGTPGLSVSPQGGLFITLVDSTEFSVNANVPWTLESSEPWLSASPASGTGNQQVVVSIDYTSAPAGDITGTLNLSSTDGSNLAASYTFSGVNSVSLSPVSLGINRTWGTEGSASVQVNSYLPWTISSNLPGVSFTPSSGTQPQTVAIELDYARIPVGSTGASVTATAGELSDTVPIVIDLTAPEALQDLSGTRNFEKSGVDAGTSVQLAIALSEQAVAPWHLDNLPDWLQASAESGNTPEDLVLSPSTPVADGIYQQTITLTVDINGAPAIEWEIDAVLEADGLKLMARDYALAHASYGSVNDRSGQGVIHISNKPESGLELTATSNMSWVQLGDWDGKDLSYQINEDFLPEGLNRATVTIDADDVSVTPVKVEVSYYKSASVRQGHAVTIPADLELIATDRSAPFAYLYSPGDHQLQVFNLHSGSFESPIQLGDSVEPGQFVFGDDGRYVFIKDTANETLEAWNLHSRLQFYGRGISGAGAMQYLRASGLPVLYVENVGWVEAAVGPLVDVATGSSAVTLGLTDLVMSPLGTMFHGLNASCDIYFQRLHYNGATRELAVTTEAADRAFADCEDADLAAAKQADQLQFVPYGLNNPMHLYSVSEIGNLSSVAGGWVIGQSRFSASFNRYGERYSLSTKVEEGADDSYILGFADADQTPLQAYTFPADVIPEAPILSSADGHYAVYITHDAAAPETRTLHTYYWGSP